MAEATPGGIIDDWTTLKQNPVFRRLMLPKRLRFLVRSPVTRAVLLTAIALFIYEYMQKQFLSLWPVLTLGILFWFLIEALQRYFCWLDLTTLARTGTLNDYVNSGLNRADIAMGVIYPAVIAEAIAIAGIVVWFALNAENTPYRLLLFLIAFLSLKRIWSPPFLFMPDIEGYMRKRNPLTLFFISLAVIVPLIIWFTIVLTLFFTLLFVLRIAGTAPAQIGQIANIGSFFGAMFLSRFPNAWWSKWRLRRFYSRYESFDDLFERYIENRD